MSRTSFLPKRLSYSSLDLYRTCPRKWWFTKATDEEPVTGPNDPRTFGKAFHAAVHELTIANVTEEVVDPLECWAKHWKKHTNGMGSEWNRRTGEMILSDAEVLQFLEKIRPDQVDDKFMVEWRLDFSLPGVDVPFLGFVDVVANGVAADHKTSQSPWDSTRAAKSDQGLVYLAGLRAIGHDGPLTFRHNVFIKNFKQPVRVQHFEVDYDEDDLKYLEERIVETWEEMKDGNFNPNPRAWCCNKKQCEFWKQCEGGRIKHSLLDL